MSNETYNSSLQGESGVNYVEIRRLVQLGNITHADVMLDGVSTSERNAEWHFLKGSVCNARGWLNDAYNYFQTACQMQPSNMEYQTALNQMNRQKGGDMRGKTLYGNNGKKDVGHTLNRCSNPNCSDCCCESCVDCCCEGSANCCCEMIG